MFHTTMESPIGTLLLLSDGTSLTGLYMRSPSPPEGSIEDPSAAPLPETIRQLQQYFDGSRTDFDLPLVMKGTEFQRRVWAALLDIPYGQTTSYGDLARRLGNPQGSRAVGLANGQNPISIIVPCHRVIGANGHLTGYGGGIENKQKLLVLERCTLL